MDTAFDVRCTTFGRLVELCFRSWQMPLLVSISHEEFVRIFPSWYNDHSSSGNYLFRLFPCFSVVKLHRNRVWSLHFHQERSKLSSDEYKITSAVIIVVVSYIICFVPASVVNFIEILNSDFELPLWLDFSSFVLIFVSHASNPLIYGFMNRQYRVSFLELLQKGSQTKRTRRNKSKRGDLHLQKHSPDPIMTSQALRWLDENNASCSKNCSTT